MTANSKTTKIYVGGLPDACKSEELKAQFEKYGKVEECDVIKNFGFVHMTDENEAKVAIEALNGSEFMGVKITVEASRSKARPKPGMSGKGQNFRRSKGGNRSKDGPRGSYDRYNHNGRAPPPQMPPPGPSGWYGGRYAPDWYPVDRGYDRAYGHPYPDPYDRRPPLPPHDDYYYRRPYDEYSPYSRRSPPRTDRPYLRDRPYYADDTRNYAGYPPAPGPSLQGGIPPPHGEVPPTSNFSIPSAHDIRRGPM